MLYKVFDLVVDSEIECLDFEQVPAGSPTLFVKSGTGAFGRPDHLTWNEFGGSGESTEGQPLSAWRFTWHGEDLLLSLRKCGDFRLTDGLRTLICYPYPNVSEAKLRSRLSYTIIPRMLGELGHLVVHASCVSADGIGSLLFMGPSGTGKSTLAASFVGDGGDLVSDDTVLLRTSEGTLVASVTGSAARLWDDSLRNLVGKDHNASFVTRKISTAKWRQQIGRDRPIPGSLPVSAVFYLSAVESTPGHDVTISAASSTRLLSALADGLLLLNPINRRHTARRFIEASEAAEACPAFYEISYPRDFTRLPDVRRAILNRIVKDGPSDRQGMAS